jgi:hypothetical protein
VQSLTGDDESPDDSDAASESDIQAA